MLGYAFMGKAHSNAFRTIPYMIYPPPAIPADGGGGRPQRGRRGRGGETLRLREVLHLVAGRQSRTPPCRWWTTACPTTSTPARRCWPRKLGKHILSEKPLGRTPAESKEMLDAVTKAGVKHMVAFNYRFVPAVRQIRYLIDSGALGRIYHFRAVYLQEWIMPHYNMGMIWRLRKDVAGSGALGDLGTHIIDLAHYLVGGVKGVAAFTKTFIEERPEDGGGMGKVDVDDAFVAAVEFENGAVGTLEATRFAGGRKNGNCFEINGEKGSVRFNLERMNELEVFWVGEQPKETQGFHNVLVSEGYHPWWNHWWPQGHMIGWEHTFIHEITHFLDAIVNDKPVGPHGATFEDGYRADVVAGAILESAATRRTVDVKY